MTERKKMKLRITLFLMAGFFIFLAFFSILKNPSSPQEGLVVWDYLFYACMLIASILMFLVTRLGKQIDEIEYKVIRDETKRLLEDDKKNYSDKLIEMNYKYLDQYYYQTKVHADRSFIMASIASVVGLILISLGIWLMFSKDIGIAYVTSAGGVIIEFIAGIFFYLYNKTISKMYQYHQKLLISQNISTSLKLTEEMDSDLKKETIKLMVDRLTLNVNDLLAKDEGK